MKARILGSGGTSAKEKKIIKEEIRKQLAEHDRQHAYEIDAIVLWTLQETFGFGEKRLKKYFDAFGENLKRLIDYYEMGEEDESWLCSYKLKQAGIDLDAWEKEKENSQSGI